VKIHLFHSLIIPAIKVLYNFLTKISIDKDDSVSTISKEIITSIQQRFARIKEMKV